MVRANDFALAMHLPEFKSTHVAFAVVPDEFSLWVPHHTVLKLSDILAILGPELAGHFLAPAKGSPELRPLTLH